jgi:hypothetical protein
MPELPPFTASASWIRRSGPWTIAGGPDPDFDDAARTVHHVLLTDPGLLMHFRRRFPKRRDADYDDIVRLLDWVWDCPHDGTANVTGYRCGACERSRASAMRLPVADDGRVAGAARVRRSPR